MAKTTETTNFQNYVAPKLIPGISQVADLYGNLEYNLPGQFTVISSNFNAVNNNTPKQEAEVVIARKLAEVAMFDVTGVDSYPFKWIDSPATQHSQAMVASFKSNARMELMSAANQEIVENAKVQQCLENSAACVRRSSEELWNNLFGVIVDEAVNYAMQEINKRLPPEWQLGIQLASEDGQYVFKGLSVGDIALDPTTNEISYKGDFFTGLTNDGISAINKMLPDWLQLNVNAGSLNLGGAKVDLDDLFSNPGQAFALGQGMEAKNLDGILQVTVGNVPYLLGSMAEHMAGATVTAGQGLLAKGMNELNRLLPSGTNARVSYAKGSVLPSIYIGPIALDVSSASLIFDPAGAVNLIYNQMDHYVFDQLPAPAQAIARAAWEALDIPGMFGLGVSNPNPQDTLTMKSQCGSGTRPATPSFTFYKPPTGTSPDGEVLMSDASLGAA